MESGKEKQTPHKEATNTFAHGSRHMTGQIKPATSLNYTTKSSRPHRLKYLDELPKPTNTQPKTEPTQITRRPLNHKPLTASKPPPLQTPPPLPTTKEHPPHHPHMRHHRRTHKPSTYTSPNKSEPATAKHSTIS